jgi:DNA-binding transcriptional LysR family regulator
MVIINHCRGFLMSFDARILTGVLAAVTETGNFARAAEALGLTLPGVSRAVARLKARVGVRIFDRTPRSVTLTGEGQRFRAAFMRLMMRVRSPTKLSRSRLGRLASSSSRVGIATILQCRAPPRSQRRPSATAP